jgi:hypothetical protein
MLLPSVLHLLLFLFSSSSDTARILHHWITNKNTGKIKPFLTKLDVGKAVRDIAKS